MKTPTITRLLLLAAAVLLIILTAGFSSALTPQKLEAALAPLGNWAPTAYIGLFALLPAFFFPVAVLAFAGGLLFGIWRGSLYTFIGAVLNCTLMFFLARFIGRAQAERLIQKRLSPQWRSRLERAGGKEGFLFLVILRLIPAVPYNLINYAFGLSDMSFRVYLIASAIGIIPGTLVFINIGDKAMEIGSPSFWAAIALLAALLILTALLGKKLFPAATKTERDNETDKKYQT